tara:strand:+ start:1303 stop:1470 length:168 start_codon:yes stop_codon:yes gene_type:complete
MSSKTFRLKYTELLDENIEREDELIIETNDIQWSMEQFCRNRRVIKMDWKQLKIK